MHVFKKLPEAPRMLTFSHHYVDQIKPYTATDIFAADIDGDGFRDIVCGSWWYKNPTWRRFDIPGIYQVHAAYDIDGDGNQEIIATRKNPVKLAEWYGDLRPGSELVWLKPLDPIAGQWREFAIGKGSGDWPHGLIVAPLLPGAKPAVVVAYHDRTPTELFEAPEDPTHTWRRRTIADVGCREELFPCDIAGNGLVDIIAGPWWLENPGDGTFVPHRFAEGFDEASRVRAADINGDGKLEIIIGEGCEGPMQKDESGDAGLEMRWSRLAWFEQGDDPRDVPWTMHVIDKVRCAHSLDVADLDGDGDLEIVCGEHDHIDPLGARCRLMVYKKAEPKARAWHRYVLDDRFEHHDGAKVFEVAPGRLAIVSHAWRDPYVHLWEAAARKVSAAGVPSGHLCARTQQPGFEADRGHTLRLGPGAVEAQRGHGGNNGNTHLAAQPECTQTMPDNRFRRGTT